MSRMLMTAAEKTTLGSVTSFEKWPGYEQQLGSKRPKQVRNRGGTEKKLLPERYKHIRPKSQQTRLPEKSRGSGDVDC